MNFRKENAVWKLARLTIDQMAISQAFPIDDATRRYFATPADGARPTSTTFLRVSFNVEGADTYAEKSVVNSDRLVPIPDDISFEVAAALTAQVGTSAVCPRVNARSQSHW